MLIGVAGALAVPASAQQPAQADVSAWVTDKFEITMRSGKGNRQAILRMLASGTRLQLLETDAEAGYSLVRTRSGAEGWVLSRYLLQRPPARITLPDVQAQLAASQEERNKLGRDLRDLKAENAALRKQLGQSQSSGDDLQRELARISTLSSNTVQIDAENRQLRQALAETEGALEDARAESRRLASRSNREWFVIGALVVMFGILVGLILPRIRWRKKSSWGEL
ncbi:MAG: TIGR04211 family SH3 domain-containing protein [Gammaproteobacteria bacterium]